MHTPNLFLPLIAAAQAHKHVTHNEALALIDALVHLAVADVANAPPQSPAPGLRLLVGSAPSGVFAGHAGAIALADEGVWRMLAPRAGWSLLVEATGAFLVHDGSLFRPISDFVPMPEELSRLGIGTAPDDLNRLAAKLNAALLTARATGEGGTGDLRFVLNKESAAATVSQLYQSAWGGRAETGLVGDDDFRVRVSADGATWHDAIVCEGAGGAVRFPGGLPGLPAGCRNLLVNPAFAVDGRGFGAGILAAGAYGYDRWRAGAAGAELVRAFDGTITLDGVLEQVIEAPELAGEIVTLSVESPDADLAIAIGAEGDFATATLPAGSGRRSASVQVPWSVHGDVLVRITAAAPTSFRRVQLETGASATAFERRPRALEEALCARYFCAVGPDAANRTIGTTAGIDTVDHHGLVVFPVRMRATPTCVATAPGTFALSVDDETGWAERALTLLDFVEASPSSARFRLSTGITTPRGRAGLWRAWGGARLEFEAEL